MGDEYRALVGFGVAEIEFVEAARELGVRFDRTMTLGRQQITATSAQLDKLEPGVPRGFAEPLLRRYGATSVRSLDASDFEDATDTHDLNEPLPETLDEQFTAVIDSGTLEHVFNLPVALRSAMRMVELHGHLIVMTPCNDSPGHGFYQLSPELLFRALAPENGYEVLRVRLREQRGRWYDVIDPVEVGRRCEFRTHRTAYLYAVARRVEVVPIFAAWPQQSDYETKWKGGTHTANRSGARRVLDHTRRLRSVAMKVRTWSWPPSYKRRGEHFKQV